MIKISRKGLSQIDNWMVALYYGRVLMEIKLESLFLKISPVTRRFKPFSLLIILMVGLALLLSACGDEARSLPPPAPTLGAPQPVQPDTSRPVYAGWAIDAYPDMTQEQMTAAVRRMKEAGANVVWISHANPARSYANEREVGLNPSVLQAFRDFSLVQHDDAVAIVQAQKRMLEACKTVGIKAVLSIGYHTQMGQEWSKQHPQDLRRDAAGKLWQVTNGNDPFASVYSPTFQKELRDYYIWIEYEFINAYRSTIMMMNLADEPSGGDYSSWADGEFARRNGYAFAQVGSDPARLRQLGQFQANVITDFMKLAGGYWQEITPGLPVTMSFDGGAAREDDGMPNLESLFQQAPANFVLTWDAYARDRGTLDVALNEDDISRLFFLVRDLAGYSARYQRKVWFWSAANSWGLGQGVDKPGTVADAQANLLYLPQLMRQNGGLLEGVVVWNYNIRTQGLYNYSWQGIQNKASWDADQMFERVSGQFSNARTLMNQAAGQPSLLFLRAPEWQYEAIGQTRPNYRQPQVDFARMDVLARNNVASATIGHWPSQPPSAQVRTVVILAPPEYLTESDLAGLRKWVNGGGTLVAPLGAVERLTGQSAAQWTGAPTMQPYGQGRLFVSRRSASELFDSRQTELQSFWRDLLGLTTFQNGFMLQTRSSYLYYQLGRPSAPPLPPPGWQDQPVQRFSSDGTAQLFRFNSASWPAWAFERSEFAFGVEAKR